MAGLLPQRPPVSEEVAREGVREQLPQRVAGLLSLERAAADGQIRPGELGHHLPAHATRGTGRGGVHHDGHRHRPGVPLGHRRDEGAALGTHRESVRGILHVTARHHRPILEEDGRAHREARIGHMGALAHLRRLLEQRLPRDVCGHVLSKFSAGVWSAPSRPGGGQWPAPPRRTGSRSAHAPPRRARPASPGAPPRSPEARPGRTAAAAAVPPGLRPPTSRLGGRTLPATSHPRRPRTPPRSRPAAPESAWGPGETLAALLPRKPGKSCSPPSLSNPCSVACRSGKEIREQPGKDTRCALGRLGHLVMRQRFGAHPRRQVGDAADAHHRDAHVAGHHHLGHRAHAHRVGPQGAQHADFRGRLVGGARHHGVHPLPQGHLPALGGLEQPRPEPGGVGLGHVRKARPQPVIVGPRQRVPPGEVDVVGDDHQIPRRELGMDAPRGVRHHQGLDAQRAQDPRGQGHLGGRIALVGMHPALHRHHGRRPHLPQHQPARVARHRGVGKVGQFRVGNDHLAREAVGERPQTTAQDDAERGRQAPRALPDGLGRLLDLLVKSHSAAIILQLGGGRASGPHFGPRFTRTSDVPADHPLEHVLGLALDEVAVPGHLPLKARVEFARGEVDGLAEVPEELRLGEEELVALVHRVGALALAFAKQARLEEARQDEVLGEDGERLLEGRAHLEVDALEGHVVTNHRGHVHEVQHGHGQVPLQAVIAEHAELRHVLRLVLEGHVGQQAPLELTAGDLLGDPLGGQRQGDAAEEAAPLVEVEIVGNDAVEGSGDVVIQEHRPVLPRLERLDRQDGAGAIPVEVLVETVDGASVAPNNSVVLLDVVPIARQARGSQQFEPDARLGVQRGKKDGKERGNEQRIANHGGASRWLPDLARDSSGLQEMRQTV
ncbi:hypothetical protein STIAU_7729 [Stigmatella aurantiaca DW4/3-1]|uniref:Uncharacterized protein n=1 Tax=Stigmatella aurantiaca (strain DW4/3-1) TaxID=378806 RepID=Q098R9_STIAD|nr:hypothetical protein STIAU_7729 [Stigmatella aurantiaca DW4/3-1]